MRSACKRRVRRGPVTALPIKRKVAWCVCANRRRTGRKRATRIGRVRERLILEAHQNRSVAGRALAARHHHRKRLANIAHMPIRQHRPRGNKRGTAVTILLRHGRAHWADACGAQVTGGIHTQHAGRGARLGRIDRKHTRVHMR